MKLVLTGPRGEGTANFEQGKIGRVIMVIHESWITPEGRSDTRKREREVSRPSLVRFFFPWTFVTRGEVVKDASPSPTLDRPTGILRGSLNSVQVLVSQ